MLRRCRGGSKSPTFLLLLPIYSPKTHPETSSCRTHWGSPHMSDNNDTLATRIIRLTQANLEHSHIYLASHLDLFPTDAIGGGSKAQRARRSLTVSLQGVGKIETDIDGKKKFFRERGKIGEFLRRHRMKCGFSSASQPRGLERIDPRNGGVQSTTGSKAATSADRCPNSGDVTGAGPPVWRQPVRHRATSAIAEAASPLGTGGDPKSAPCWLGQDGYNPASGARQARGMRRGSPPRSGGPERSGARSSPVREEPIGLVPNPLTR